MLRVNGVKVIAADDILIPILAGNQRTLARNLRPKGPFAQGVLCQQFRGYALGKLLRLSDVVKVERGKLIQKGGNLLSLVRVIVAEKRMELN